MALDYVIVGPVEISTHPEIGNFDSVVLSDKAISSGQISVNKVLVGQIFHSTSDLCG